LGHITGPAQTLEAIMSHPTAFANSLALVAGALFVLCRALAGLAPGLFAAVGQSWFHGLVVAPQPWPAMDAPSFVLGLVTLAVTAWLFGFAWAWVYGRLADGRG
jgi:hypothetical protein